MHMIPGLRLRVSEGIEQAGIDKSEMGESAYDHPPFHLPSITSGLASPRNTGRLRVEVIHDVK